MIIIHNF